MSRKGKVLVAMSGGIDSTVTALMLHNEGYEVIGITMKTWDYATSGGGGKSKKETGCCNLDSFNDARMAAVHHGFPHFILDIRDEFGDFVVENFVEEYLAGRTPNPCVMCNTHIKWRALLKRADAMDCEFIATGHYAKINAHTNGRYYVSKGLDETKDQSYVLWGLQQDLLSRTILPLGKYHKTEIRQMAHDMGYPELAKKSESYEICFVPDNDYRGFLKRRVNGLEEKIKQESQKAREKAIEKVLKDAKLDAALWEKEQAANIEVYELKITTLESSIQENNTQIGELMAQLNAALERVQSLAANAVSGNK